MFPSLGLNQISLVLGFVALRFLRQQHHLDVGQDPTSSDGDLSILFSSSLWTATWR